jgi:hypothetical protein
MIAVESFVETPRGRPGHGGGQRKGSRRKVVLADGSVVKWWGGEWRFSKARWNSRVATSLNTHAMVVAAENGSKVVDIERYTDFGKFMERMVGVVGSYEFLRIVEFIQGR